MLITIPGALLWGAIAGPGTIVGLAPRCIFRETAGFVCPTCGTSRALDALSHGDVWAALAFNPALPIIIGATMWASWVMARGTGARLPVSVARLAVFIGVVWIVNILNHHW